MSFHKRLLVIGAGRFQASGIRKAKELGCHVTAVDGDAEAPGFALADRRFVVNFSDVGAVERALENERFEAVTAFSSDAAMPAVSRLAARFGLSGPSSDVLQNALQKDRMRELFERAGLKGPRFRRVTDISEARGFFQALGRACVVKPVDSSGSRGVTKVDRAGRLEESFRLAKGHSKSGIVLIEEFIEGAEVAVDGFFVNGHFIPLMVTDKERTKPPALLDETLFFPSGRSESVVRAILECAEKMVRAAGIQDTPFHLEIIMGVDGKPHPVEIAARGAGFKVYSDIVPALSGVDALRWQIELALGKKTEYRPRRSALRACLFFVASSKDGIAADWDEPAARELLSEKDELEIYCRPGHRVRALVDGSCRIGHGILYGENASALGKKKDEILRRLRLRVSDGL